MWIIIVCEWYFTYSQSLIIPIMLISSVYISDCGHKQAVSCSDFHLCRRYSYVWNDKDVEINT